MRPYNQETLDTILKFVNKYYQDHHSSPTINEVAAGVGVARSTTHRYITVSHISAIGWRRRFIPRCQVFLP